MTTPEDWYLKPQAGALSTLVCRHCGEEIGDVLTAGETHKGRNTGRSEEEITMDAQQISRGHLPQCRASETAANPADSEIESPKRPPESAPLKNRRH